MDDPFISGDKSFLKGTVLQVLLSPLCPRSHVMDGIAMRLLKKQHVPLVVFLHVTLVRDRNLDY